ncbi:MAG: rod shape-determining protein MreD [Bacteroidaceae bacterium]|nr:rod shape-determining protein MreD [Bacteroidaceae bacterium]
MGAISIFRKIGQIILLVALQVLIFNKINLFGYVTPLLYIWVTVKIENSYSRSAILLFSFFTGLAIDMFTGTPGVNAAAITLLAFLQPYILKLFVLYDRRELMIPGADTMKRGPFIGYVSLCAIVHHLFYFILKSIPVADWSMLMSKVVFSAALTVLLIVVIEISFVKNSNKKGRR